VNKADQ